jgi:hypothetical protein
MLFGMGLTLTKEEDESLAHVVYPCYAALGLANDYFSFDREWEEAQRPGALKPVNAVWLYMQWRGVDAATAKDLVREAANHYENTFLALRDKFRRDHAPISEKLDRYLRALTYEVSGNVVWSLNCPRYHREFRYDLNAGIEHIIPAQKRDSSLQVHDEESSDDASLSARRESIMSLGSQFSESASAWSGKHSRSSSISAVSEYSDDEMEADVKLPTNNKLGTEVSDTSSFRLIGF